MTTPPLWTPDQDRNELRDILRMWPTVIVALVTVAIVAWLAPQQLGILVYTLAKLSLAGYLGYWLDRWVFPYDRVSPPSTSRAAPDQTAAQYRRAAVVIGALIAAGLMS